MRFEPPPPDWPAPPTLTAPRPSCRTRTLWRQRLKPPLLTRRRPRPRPPSWPTFLPTPILGPSRLPPRLTLRPGARPRSRPSSSYAPGLRASTRPTVPSWLPLGSSLTPFDQERAAYALVRLLKDTEIGEKPDLNRVRTGALAVFSATYRRLRANQAVTAPLAEDDVTDAESRLEAPNFFAPLAAQIALSIQAKAQGVVVDGTPPDDKTLRKILGGLKRKTTAQREQAARLFQAARRALPDGASLSSCCLAACFALLSLNTLSEISRLELPCPDEWLSRFISFLEEADVVFSGQIGLLVSQERGPVEATVSTTVPSLKTDSSSSASLRSQNRCPVYDPGMQGWRHVAGDHQDVWSGVGLQAVPVHPDATSLPEPRRDEEGSKLACPATTGQIFGNRCLNCATKRLRGGCVNRLDRSNGGVAHHQGHLTMHESPVLAILWNAEGLPRREEDVGPGGFPSYLGDEPPPGRPKPGCYILNRRPCGLPERDRADRIPRRRRLCRWRRAGRS